MPIVQNQTDVERKWAKNSVSKIQEDLVQT